MSQLKSIITEVIPVPLISPDVFFHLTPLSTCSNCHWVSAIRNAFRTGKMLNHFGRGVFISVVALILVSSFSCTTSDTKDKAPPTSEKNVNEKDSSIKDVAHLDRTQGSPAAPEKAIDPKVNATPRKIESVKSAKKTVKKRRSPKSSKPEDANIAAVKAAIRFIAKYPSRIKFAPIEEWEIGESYKGWVEQDDGFREDFTVRLTKGDIPKGHFRAYDKAQMIPEGKVWVHIWIDDKILFEGGPHRRGYYDSLEPNWRVDKRFKGDAMLYDYTTKKIE